MLLHVPPLTLTEIGGAISVVISHRSINVIKRLLVIMSPGKVQFTIIYIATLHVTVKVAVASSFISFALIL